MDRRDTLKALAVSAFSTALLVEGCKSPETQESATAKPTIDRTEEELANDARIKAMKFFSSEEMATIAVLCDIIIPADEFSGSATDAKVPEFIEFIVNDIPEHQLPLRGGLRWLNLESIKRFGKSFTDSTAQQRIILIDDIAYPEKAKPDMFRGVSFFNLMRNLTATGFYTSELGIKDLGYKGNVPNQWKGVPADVLKQYGYAYTEKEVNECVKYT